MPKCLINDYPSFIPAIRLLIKRVGEHYKIVDYYNIFARYSKEYNPPKRVCFQVMRNRGLSTSQVGRMFGRDHTTIVSGLQKITQEEYKLAEKIGLEMQCIFKNSPQKKVSICVDAGLIKQVRDCINEQISEDDIKKQFQLSDEVYEMILSKIKKLWKPKKCPDYHHYKTIIKYL